MAASSAWQNKYKVTARKTDAEDVTVRRVDDLYEFAQAVSLQKLVGKLLFLDSK